MLRDVAEFDSFLLLWFAEEFRRFVVMAKYLEHDYDIDRRPTGLIPHFHDTIAALGGLPGLFLLFAGVIAFYWGISFFIRYNRSKRDKKKN